MQSNTRTYLIQAILFVLTIITTTMAGAEWIYGSIFAFIYDFAVFLGGDNAEPKAFEKFKLLGWYQFMKGFQFSIPFLAILTIHEFGHYFVAKYHRVKVTLPYYIPLWFGISQSIGTMGAFIRIKSVVKSRLKFFDIGIAGPLAGFIAALVVLWYGFTHLPPPEYIFTIHPEYARYGLNYPQFAYENPAGNLILGDNILFSLFKKYVADPARLPHAYEMIHYPYIFAGYLALFFTSLNLIPIGQLDGGHILYGLIGKKRFNIIAPVLFGIFAFYSGLGLFRTDSFATGSNAVFYERFFYLAIYVYFLFVCFKRVSDNPATALMIALIIVVGQFAVSYIRPDWEGSTGFLPFVFILGRFLGILHPETDENAPLDTPRIILGICALVIFVISFSPTPFIVIE
ncbi:site-2 protease family protein [Dyadobacter arcticus]|uniref:Membrane-associated protease RseP (Regulator of RpoE activity) n=1 Tax=Dyadobacter arcticus TaxID=1078754 RepID=A0ABX0UIT5_9BACT|nr:site-2 protease family protein [Dyadobacter arcticus]NIJ52423.1 membrane-associated protease RseP (regulator of RpoE activity) [Dyadobacter arcticus]